MKSPTNEEERKGPRKLLASLTYFWQRAKCGELPWHRALLLTLILRVVYSALAAIVAVIQPVNWRLFHSNAFTESVPLPNHSLHYLLVGVWERFDTLWYLHIAAHGYDRPDAVVFFPGYPALIKAFSVLMPPMVAALLISTTAAFFLFWGLQELLLADYSSNFVDRSVFVYAVWPASFILFAGYPESLFLALVTWALCMARGDRWATAALLGLAATLTKAAGIVVVLPLLIMAIRRKKASALPVLLIPLLLIPLGVIGYLQYLRWMGLPTVASAYALYWRTAVAPPSTTLWASLHSFAQSPSPILALNLIFLLAVCALAISSRVRIEYLLYSAAAICFFLCKETTPPLQSMIRYLLMIFPASVGFTRCFQRSHLQPRFAIACACLFVINLGLLWLFLGWSLIL